MNDTKLQVPFINADGGAVLASTPGGLQSFKKAWATPVKTIAELLPASQPLRAFTG